jgi:hypothetical protein
MEAVLLDRSRMKVTLSARELEEMAVHIAAPDRRITVTRGFLLRLLELGKALTGFDPRGARLLAEVYASGSGDGVFIFTALFGAGTGGENIPPPVVFAFGDALTLYRCAAGAGPRCAHRIYKSSLFKYGEGYRLIVYPLDYSDRLAECFLGEYGRLAGEGHILAAHIGEHGREVIRDDALERLARGITGGKIP